jgi:hypothetical protein
MQELENAREDMERIQKERMRLKREAELLQTLREEYERKLAERDRCLVARVF